MSKDKETIQPVYTPGIVGDEIKDLSKDLYFIKKNEKAKKMVDRVGLPEDFLKKK